MPRYWAVRVPLVPWSDIKFDVCEANDGEVELTRDVHVNGRAERQIGMLCVTQYRRDVALGLIAIRCERHGDQLIPLTCAIPETPAAVIAEPPPVQSNPVRRRYRDDDYVGPMPSNGDEA